MGGDKNHDCASSRGTVVLHFEDTILVCIYDGLGTLPLYYVTIYSFGDLGAFRLDSEIALQRSKHTFHRCIYIFY